MDEVVIFDFIKTSIFTAYIVCRFNRSPKEKFMVCSARNVAVSILVQATIATMEKDHVVNPRYNGGLFSLVHIESEGVIDAHYLCGRQPSGDYHLQNIRI